MPNHRSHDRRRRKLFRANLARSRACELDRTPAPNRTFGPSAREQQPTPHQWSRRFSEQRRAPRVGRPVGSSQAPKLRSLQTSTDRRHLIRRKTRDLTIPATRRAASGADPPLSDVGMFLRRASLISKVPRERARGSFQSLADHWVLHQGRSPHQCHRIDAAPVQELIDDLFATQQRHCVAKARSPKAPEAMYWRRVSGL